MKALLPFAVLVAFACGSAPSPTGAPLGEFQLRFAVMDAVGKPVYCDPDFYPVARTGGEQANAISMYPQIKSDTDAYAAIVAHEHLPSGDLTDAQKLIVYRAYKLLRVLFLTRRSDESDYTFQYRIQPSANAFQMVAGRVRVDGAVSVTSRTSTGPPNCPICLAASTFIATPSRTVRVTDVRVGMIVWTQDARGDRVAARVVAVGSTPVPAGHMMVHLVLADGRELLVSPGHKTADGRAVGSLSAGDSLDGSKVTLWELAPYAGEKTYDLLPAGPTGRYWANGILLSSTLS